MPSWRQSSAIELSPRKPELQEGVLVNLDFTHPHFQTELGITEVGKRSRSPAAQKFIDILDKEICNSDSFCMSP